MEQQYYTPKEEDLFMGYECQERGMRFKREEGSNKTVQVEIWNDIQIFCLPTPAEDLRTPYLTLQQIEAEGWFCKHDQSVLTEDGLVTSMFKMPLKHARGNTSAVAIYIHRSNWLCISIFDNQTIFAGICPSINEFRKICKWIGVTTKNHAA